MAVPLGHKNHKSSRTVSDSFKDIKINDDDYKKTSNAILSKDGKVFYGIWKPVSGDYKLPKGVEVVAKHGFYNLHTRIIIIKNSLTIKCSAFTSPEFLVYFKLKRCNHSFLGRIYCLTPEKIVLKTRDTKKAYSNTVKQMCDEKNIPEKIKEFLLNYFVSTKILPKRVEPLLVDDNVNELYSNEGKCLLKVYNCNEEYTVKTGVEEIGTYAIDTYVKKITIPSSVKKIGHGSLRTKGRELPQLRFEGVVDDILNSSIIIYGYDKPSVIEVKKGTKSHYDKLLPNIKDYIVEYDDK